MVLTFVLINSRRQLRKAVVDHISDSFLEPDTPLLMLMSAAREGREKEVTQPLHFAVR
jgi:catenin alpha